MIHIAVISNILLTFRINISPSGIHKGVLHDPKGGETYLHLHTLPILQKWSFRFWTVENVWTEKFAAVTMRTYHSDADGVIELVHEDADNSGCQQQQDERIFELEREVQH